MIVYQAEADADTLIAETALELSLCNTSVTVVATDTDILTILIARYNQNTSNLYMLKPGSGNQSPKYYNIAELQQNLGDLKDVLLFAHAMSGCDTTSAFFRKGKVKTFQCLSKNTELRKIVSIFNNPQANPDEIASAGEAFVLNLYNKSELDVDLDELRYYMYKQTVAKQSIKDNFQLSSLPPTKDATRQHSYRAYLQV